MTLRKYNFFDCTRLQLVEYFDAIFFTLTQRLISVGNYKPFKYLSSVFVLQQDSNKLKSKLSIELNKVYKIYKFKRGYLT